MPQKFLALKYNLSYCMFCRVAFSETEPLRYSIFLPGKYLYRRLYITHSKNFLRNMEEKNLIVV